MSNPSNKAQFPCPTHADKVVNAVSHDLAGPTRQIRIFLQLLEKHLGEGLDREGREYVDLIGSAADTLHTRLEGLKLLSRATTANLEPKDLDVSKVVAMALNQLVSRVEESGATIQADTPIGISADRDLMSTVFVELFENALKFCEAPVHIEVTSQVDQGSCLVTVSDSGPGFKARNHNDAFELFKKFHLDARPGTGTGLAVVHRILERHGSSPTITSDPSTGTTIQFALPLACLN